MTVPAPSRYPSSKAFRLLEARVDELTEMAKELGLGMGETVLLEVCIETAFDHVIGGEPAGVYMLAFEAARKSERPEGKEVRTSYRLSSTHMTQLRDLGLALELTQGRVVELLVEALRVEGGPWGGPRTKRRDQLRRVLRIIYSSDPLDGLDKRRATRPAATGALSSLPP